MVVVDAVVKEFSNEDLASNTRGRGEIGRLLR